MRKQLFATLLFTILSDQILTSQDTKKPFLAGVDLTRIIVLHPEIQRKLTELAKERDLVRTSLSTEFEKYQKIVEEGRRIEEQLLSPAISESRRRELRAKGATIIQQAKEKGQQLQEFRQKKIQEFNEKYQAESKRILAMIQDKITQLSKEKGVTIVINTAGLSRSNTPIMQYLDPHLDLTDDLLRSFGVDPATQTPSTAISLFTLEQLSPSSP